MIKSDGYGEQIRGQDVYLRHLMDISRLSGSAYTSTSNEWQKNVLNYESAVETLESLAYPFLPPNYFKIVQELKKRAKEYREKVKNESSPFEMIRVGRDLEVKLTRKVTNERLKLIVVCLNEQNLLIPKHHHAIEDDIEDEDEYMEGVGSEDNSGIGETNESDGEEAPFADETLLSAIVEETTLTESPNNGGA